MDRLPFWSLSSFLLCVVGITMFSGGLYATAEQVIKQLDLPVYVHLIVVVNYLEYIGAERFNATEINYDAANNFG
jgi:predicted Na+-dependent transporter